MKPKHYLLITLISIPILFIQYFIQLPDGLLHVIFLNVGQGDSIFINTPSNKHILIDGGPSTKVTEELAKVMSFNEHQIDFVILTHPDNDHVFGLVEVLKKFNVKKLIITGINFKNPNYAELLKSAKEKNIEIIIADENKDVQLEDGVFIDILYPYESLLGQEAKDVNASSVIIKLIYGEMDILLAGDSDIATEKGLILKNIDLKSEILKLSHHGSKTSNSMEFINEVNPDYAVIQVGSNNKFGHPNIEVLKRLIEKNIPVYRTDINGRIEFVMDKEKIVRISNYEK